MDLAHLTSELECDSRSALHTWEAVPWTGRPATLDRLSCPRCYDESHLAKCRSFDWRLLSQPERGTRAWIPSR